MKWSKVLFLSVFDLTQVDSFSPHAAKRNVLSASTKSLSITPKRSDLGKANEGIPTLSTTPLYQSTKSLDTSATEFDSEAVFKYAVSGATELSLFAGSFYLLDFILAQASLTSSIPPVVVGFIFYACSLKSRVFNPLNNQRPQLKGDNKPAKGFRDRVMPSWTPPGVVFPIMWLLIIGPIRAYSSTLIVEANNGIFCTPATLAFIFHLTVGDIWNTINNTEKRYGAAVVGVLGVVASVFVAANQYYQVDPVAGKFLGGTALWLVTAATLIADTWRLNPDENGNKDPLYPTKIAGSESITQFAWFKNNDAVE